MRDADVTIVQPPRPVSVQRSVRGTGAERRSPPQDLISVANELRETGFNADVEDADGLSSIQFRDRIDDISKRSTCVAFFVRSYRQQSAILEAGRLQRIPGPRPQLMIFGFLPRGFDNTSDARKFDFTLMGPAWRPMIEFRLRELGISPGTPKKPVVDLVDFQELTNTPGPAVRIEAPSRGCPHECTFCEHQILKGYRDTPDWLFPRPVDEVIREVSVAVDNGATAAVFLEGNFLTYPKWTALFVEEWQQQLNGLPFAINTRLSDIGIAQRQGLIARLRKAGLVSVCSGLESGSDAILRRMRKHASVAQYEHGDTILRQYGLKRFYNIVLGLAGETYQTIQQTRDLIEKLQPDGLQVSIATPLPGTEFHEEALREGWLTTDNLDEYYYYGSCVLERDELPAAELLRIQSEIHCSFSAAKSVSEVAVSSDSRS